MNSAPSSTGSGQPAGRRVRMRPPSRDRASSSSTELPASTSSSAADKPAAPPPTTIASHVFTALLLLSEQSGRQYEAGTVPAMESSGSRRERRRLEHRFRKDSGRWIGERRR